MINEFKTNEKVIYDSGFGYDIAIFINEVDSFNYHIILKTGMLGHTYVLKNEVYKYTHELIEELVEKYGYRF